MSQLVRHILQSSVPTVCNIAFTPHILLFCCFEGGAVSFRVYHSLSTMLPQCTILGTVTSSCGNVPRALVKADDPGIPLPLWMRLWNWLKVFKFFSQSFVNVVQQVTMHCHKRPLNIPLNSSDWVKCLSFSSYLHICSWKTRGQNFSCLINCMT